MAGDDLTIRVGGDASGVSNATQQAAGSINQLGTSAQASVAAILEAFRDAGVALQGFTQQVNMASGAMGQFGGMATQTLQNTAQTAQVTMGNGPGGMGAVISDLGTALQHGGESFVDFGGKILGAINPLNLLHSHMLKLLEVMGAWRIMEGGVRFLQETIGQVVDLPMTNQYQEMAWKYQYGGGAKGQAMAQQVMGWTFNESLNMPYTRQDMTSAISVLNALGLSPQGIEKYLPVIADIAASAGTNMYGQPITLQQAAMSIMGAGMGYTRMLKYDLKINPDELRQFGYTDTGNMAELMSALQKYAQKHGRIGASWDLAHNTLQGGLTSVQDRFQNFALMLGGMTMSGETDKGGLLQALMDTMNMFTGATDQRVWDSAKTEHEFNRMRRYDSHTASGRAALQAYENAHSQVNIKNSLLGVAQLIGHDVASAFKDARDMVVAFTGALQKSGLFDMVGKGFSAVSNWLQAPSTHQMFTHLGTFAGNVIGPVAKAALQNLGSDFKIIEDAWNKVIKSMTPEQRAQLMKILEWLGATFEQFAGAMATTAAQSIADNLTLLGDALKFLADVTRGDTGRALYDVAVWLSDMFQSAWDFIGLEPQFKRDIEHFFGQLGNDFHDMFVALGNIINAYMQAVFPWWHGLPSGGAGPKDAPRAGPTDGRRPGAAAESLPSGNLLAGMYGAYGAYGAGGPTTNQFYISGMGYADTARLIDDVVNDRERWGGQVMHGPGGFRTWGQVGGAFGT